MMTLIGKRFAPRLRNITDRKFHAFEKANSYPALANRIGAPTNTALILEHWDDLLRLAASITTLLLPQRSSKGCCPPHRCDWVFHLFGALAQFERVTTACRPPRRPRSPAA